MRSKLFVPGSRPELFSKALATAADALSFDLEDAVVPQHKHDARRGVAAFLSTIKRRPDKSMIVRTNSLESGLLQADLEAVVSPGLDMINLPKVESADQVRTVAEILGRLEGKQSRPVGLLVNIETPKGVRHAAEISTADARIVGLQVGYGDLFEPFGIDRKARSALDAVRLAVRLAAAEAGLPAYDGAYAGIADMDFFREEAVAARQLGFAGKSCIHPAQISIANAVFTPNEDELRHARAVMAAAEAAFRNGIGAFTVDGRMVDKPFVESAARLLALAERTGTGGGEV